jgi:hypothetical protein
MFFNIEYSSVLLFVTCNLLKNHDVIKLMPKLFYIERNNGSMYSSSTVMYMDRMLVGIKLSVTLAFQNSTRYDNIMINVVLFYLEVLCYQRQLVLPRLRESFWPIKHYCISAYNTEQAIWSMIYQTFRNAMDQECL